jgi:chromosome segregation ATPase
LQFERSIELLRSDYAEYQKQTNREISDLSEQLDLTRHEREALEQDHEQLQHEYAAHQAQTEGEVNQLNESQQMLQLENDSLRSKVSELEQRAGLLQGSSDQLTNAQQQIQTLCSQLDEVRSLLSQEQERASSLKQENQRLQDVCLEQDHTKGHLQTKIQALDEQARNRDAELSALREQSTQSQQQSAQQLQQTYLEKQQLQQELDRVHAEHHASVEAFEAKIAGLNQQLNVTVSGHQELEERHNQLQSAAAEKQLLQQHADTLRSENENLKHELSNLRSQFDQICRDQEEQVEVLRQENKQLSEQHQRLADSGIQAQERMDALISQLQQQQESIKQFELAQAALQASEDEVAGLRNENDRLQTELDALQSQIKTAIEPMQADTNVDDHEFTEPMEQQPAADIPTYNLAEQIMSEHRRSIAARRQRPVASTARDKIESVENVVKQYISEPIPVGPPQHGQNDSYYDLWNDTSLTSFQQELLREIIHKDISLYSER